MCIGNFSYRSEMLYESESASCLVVSDSLLPYGLSHVWLFATLWTVACQAPLSMGVSKQEYWSGLPFSSPGDLPNPGIKPISLMSPELADGFFTTIPTWEAHTIYSTHTHTHTHKIFNWKFIPYINVLHMQRVITILFGISKASKSNRRA